MSRSYLTALGRENAKEFYEDKGPAKKAKKTTTESK